MRTNWRERAAENRRRFAEAEAATPEPVGDRDVLIAACVAEGPGGACVSGVTMPIADALLGMPTEDIRSLLHDWRVLTWLAAHYPENVHD